MGEPALKAADFVSRSPAMRADRSVRPKLLLDVIEGRLLVVKSRVGKDRFGHGLAPIAKPYRCTFGMSSETSPVKTVAVVGDHTVRLIKQLPDVGSQCLIGPLVFLVKWVIRERETMRLFLVRPLVGKA